MCINNSLVDATLHEVPSVSIYLVEEMSVKKREL